MVEVIHYIFETEQDIKLYFNRKTLISELLHFFPLQKINQALDWFFPIIEAKNHRSYLYEGNAVREFDYFENKYLPKILLDKILVQHKQGTINLFERDMIIDRLTLIAKQNNENGDLERVLEDLLIHFNQYKFGILMPELKPTPHAWNPNFTIH